MMRDAQKSKLYSAEQVLRKHDVHFRSMPQMETYIAKIIASEWWQERSKIAKIDVVLGRRDSGKAFYCSRGTYRGKS